MTKGAKHTWIYVAIHNGRHTLKLGLCRTWRKYVGPDSIPPKPVATGGVIAGLYHISCYNLAYPARGQVSRGNIGIYSQKE